MGNQRLPGLASAALASFGAGAVNAVAMGTESTHPGLARALLVVCVLQLGAAMRALVQPRRLAAAAVAGANALAVSGWLLTRIMGVSFISGLHERGVAHAADTICAGLGAAALGAALGALLIGWQDAEPVRLTLPIVTVVALALPAMWLHGSASATGNQTAGASVTVTSVLANGSIVTVTTTADTTAETIHDHNHVDTTVVGVNAAGQTVTWPRPWDPTKPIDLSGVPGVTAAEQARATKLVQDALKYLPKYASTATALANGYQSIGDAATGVEHYINYRYINDSHFLDPRYPESLVYAVKGSQRILSGAMFIASARASDDPTLTGWAGPLMTWHNHGNLCWDVVNGHPMVVGITDASGKCSRGVNTGGANPMVHVWITAQACGVFSALEGVGAGQAAVPDSQRTDECHTHA